MLPRICTHKPTIWSPWHVTPLHWHTLAASLSVQPSMACVAANASQFVTRCFCASSAATAVWEVQGSGHDCSRCWLPVRHCSKAGGDAQA